MNMRKKRLFDHVVVHVKDINQSKKFYRALVETLGHTITLEETESFFIDELEVRQGSISTNHAHLAFSAENPGLVKLFHETALKFGGKCSAVPTCTSKGTYKAEIIDPDGNYIEAVFKGSIALSPHFPSRTR